MMCRTKPQEPLAEQSRKLRASKVLLKVMNPFFSVPNEVLTGNILAFLSFRDVVLVEAALAGQARENFCRKLRGFSLSSNQPVMINQKVFSWLRDHCVRVRNASMSHTITNDMFVENIDLLVTVEIVSFYKNSAINFQSICSFLLQSPKLIEIKFSYSDEAIDQLVDTLSCSENLRKLDVRTLEKLNTGQSLLTLMQKVPNLTDINLPYHLSADDVKLIPYESLLAISFGGYHTSEHFLEELCINCPHLCSINISSCDLNNSHIEVLVRYHKNMQSLMLTVDQDMQVTDEGLVPLVAISTSLEYLSLDSPFITDLTVNALATHCPRLKCLMLDRSPTISSRAM